jgi:TATA-binding protein-associated factor
VKNLCTFLCQDVEQTPTFAYTRQHTDGILSLHAVNPPSQQNGKDNGKLKDKPDVGKPDESAKARLSRRGARLAFDQLAVKFGPRLLDIIPSMWQSMAGGLVSVFQSGLFQLC